MNRIKLIINLLLGKDIVIYDSWHKEVLMIIGSDKEIITKRYDYDFIDKETECLVEKEEKLYYEKELEE